MKWVLLAIVCALAVAAAAQNAGVSRVLTDADKAKWKALAEGAQQPDGSFASIRDAYYAVSTLAVAGSSVPRKGDVCKQAKAVLADDASPLDDVHFAVMVAAELGCLQPPSAGVAGSIIASLEQDGAEVIRLYCAVQAGVTLRAKKLLSKLRDELLDSAVEALAAHFDNEHMTAMEAALAYEAAATAAAAVPSLSEDARAALEVMSELVLDALALGEEQEDGSVMFATAGVTGALASSQMLRGLHAFDAVQKSDLPSDLSSSVGEWLLNHAPVATAEDAYAVSSGVAAIQRGSGRPLALVCETASVSALEKAADIIVSVTDIWGGAVPNPTTYLLEASLHGKPVVANKEMRELGNGRFAFNILAAKPAPGHYLVSLTASTTAGQYAPIEAGVCIVRVSLPVKVSKVTFTVKDPQYDETVMTTEGSKSSHFEAAAFHDVHAKFSVSGDGSSSKPVMVQQAFLVFDSLDGEVEAVVPARSDGKHYRATISMARDGELFQFHTGRYSVRLFVADAFVENAVVLNLGEAKLRFPPGLENKAKHHTVYEHKADIAHQFRGPEKRPPQSFSWMFTLVVLAPIAVLLIGILTAFPNVSIPTSSVGFVSSVAFLACVGLGALVLWLYWVRWNLFEAGQAMALVLVGGTVFGKYALRARQANKAKVE